MLQEIMKLYLFRHLAQLKLLLWILRPLEKGVSSCLLKASSQLTLSHMIAINSARLYAT
jgi:hypothetical protein